MDVFLSAYDDFQYAQQAIRYGVRFYILKPSDFEEIKEIFKEIKRELDGQYQEIPCIERIHNAVSYTHLIIKMAPPKVVYVSCDPATLARDVKYLGEHGYELKRVRCCDMFGHSVHVDCLLYTSRCV